MHSAKMSLHQTNGITQTSHPIIKYTMLLSSNFMGLGDRSNGREIFIDLHLLCATSVNASEVIGSGSDFDNERNV